MVKPGSAAPSRRHTAFPTLAGVAGRIGLAGLAGATVAACGPAADAPDTSVVDGEWAYTVRCSYCHDVPNGIGAELDAVTLASYTTVGELDRYLRIAMPHEAPGTLSDAEYDAILRYMVESRQLVPEGGDVWPLPDSTRLQTP